MANAIFDLYLAIRTYGPRRFVVSKWIAVNPQHNVPVCRCLQVTSLLAGSSRFYQSVADAYHLRRTEEVVGREGDGARGSWWRW